MLKSELQPLESLIGEIVNFNETGHDEIRVKDLGATLPRIKEACGHLRVKWVQELFSNVKDNVIHRYVQFHQAGIVSLSDHLSAVSLTESNPIVHDIVELLEGLLGFLQNSFYKYFDPEHTVTANLCRKETKKISTLLESAVTDMQSAGIDLALIQAIRRTLNEIIEQAPHSGISHRKIAYIKELLTYIREQLKTGSIDTSRIVGLLYQKNFNSFYFERWYQERLSRLVTEAKPKDQHRMIQLEAARLENSYIELNKSFDADRPSLDITLLGLLTLQLNEETLAANKTGRATEPVRMPLNFSVAQFALFIRLCYLEGCFNLNNISSIQRFFTHHFETKKQLHISPKSFGRAFYGADQATAAVVRDVLLRMVGIIDKTYFPKI